MSIPLTVFPILHCNSSIYVTMDIECLTSERKKILSCLERHKQFVNAVPELNVDTTEELQARLKVIESLYEKFEDKQLLIEKLYFKEKNISELTIQEEERKQFEEIYFQLVGSIKSKVNKFFGDTIGSVVNNIQGGIQDTQSGTTILQKSVQLPSIKLPSFSGQYNDWIDFRDCFKSLIHENNELTKVQKFYYLRSSLEKEALNLIQSIQVSDANYIDAWELLICERYEQKAILVYNHIRALFEYPKLEYENHYKLRNFYDSLQKNLEAR